MAQSPSKRRSRKRRRRSSQPGAGSRAEPQGAPASSQSRGAEAPVSRSTAKDEAARAKLEPLAEGERPRAVTVAAVVAFLMGAATLVLYVTGFEIRGGRPPLPLVIGQSGLFLIAAWGMWRARYWAVLGMQALLGLIVTYFTLQIVIAVPTVARGLIPLAIVLAAGTLFWFLVKAMARIQMPERR